VEAVGNFLLSGTELATALASEKEKEPVGRFDPFESKCYGLNILEGRISRGQARPMEIPNCTLVHVI